MAPTPNTTPPSHGGDLGTETTLTQIDQQFQNIGCLGHGGFGSVFLAQKRHSGRKVALKFIRFDLDCDLEDEHESFSRELDAVLRLESTNNGDGRDLSIVFFEDWFHGHNFACFVMFYADGGTLAQEIESKSDPYSERRIAWYALQLSEALAHAHERGVTHQDVKSSNVLIDRTGGGRLLLADFGSAVGKGEETGHFTEIYAAPELQTAYALDDFTGLDLEKIDSFGLGCTMFEMLCCKKIVDLTTEQTLAEYIQANNSVDAALDLPCLRFPWMPEVTEEMPVPTSAVGYSRALRSLVKLLLQPDPSNRWSPSDLQKPLRIDPLSPLLADYAPAAQCPSSGAPLTMDNIQLGMFVQRGRDWNDGDSDGGPGSVGVVIKLDADAGYTEVAFPSRTTEPPKPMCCRIGAGNKFELQVGPTVVKDFFGGTEKPKSGGVVYSTDTSRYQVGRMVNDNCMVVGIQPKQCLFLVAPMEKILIPALPFALPIQPLPVGPVAPRKPLRQPESWEGPNLLAEVVDSKEKRLVTSLFYSNQGGLNSQFYQISSIKRVQSGVLWTKFAEFRERIAAENWGIVNEQRLFHGSGQHSPETLLQNPNKFYTMCASVAEDRLDELSFSESSKYGDLYSNRTSDADISVSQMILSRVALGRMREKCPGRPNYDQPLPPYPLKHHSRHKKGPSGSEVYTVCEANQAYPEYIITYKAILRADRRLVRARRPQDGSPTGLCVSPRGSPRLQQQVAPTVATPLGSRGSAFASPRVFATPQNQAEGQPTTPGSATKMCVICLERPVSHCLVPCGHVNLCDVCVKKLKRFKRQCPECRKPVREVVKTYARVVED